MQHFALLAGQQPLPTSHLDAMLPFLLSLTPEVPLYAATVARARIQKMNERLTQTHADPSIAQGNPSQANGWPPARTVLMLKLFITLFPVSDRR